jgi:hypothetical protein
MLWTREQHWRSVVPVAVGKEHKNKRRTLHNQIGRVQARITALEAGHDLDTCVQYCTVQCSTVQYSAPSDMAGPSGAQCRDRAGGRLCHQPSSSIRYDWSKVLVRCCHNARMTRMRCSSLHDPAAPYSKGRPSCMGICANAHCCCARPALPAARTRGAGAAGRPGARGHAGASGGPKGRPGTKARNTYVALTIMPCVAICRLACWNTHLMLRTYAPL